MKYDKTVRKIEKSLFAGDKAVESLKPKEYEIQRRYLALFHMMLEHPEKKDVELVSFLMETYKIGRSQAFYDLQNVKMIFGNVQRSAKEWDRYVVLEMLKEAYKRAEKENDLKNMISAADKLGKYTKLDQEEGRELPYDEIVPLQIEPTGDVSVLGLKPVVNLREKQRALREKYGKVEDVSIVQQEEEEDEQ